MKIFLTVIFALCFCLAVVNGFFFGRRCVITNNDCTANSRICARIPRGVCRTFINPCSMETENCYRLIPFTQTALTDCNGLAESTLGVCAS